MWNSRLLVYVLDFQRGLKDKHLINEGKFQAKELILEQMETYRIINPPQCFKVLIFCRKLALL